MGTVRSAGSARAHDARSEWATHSEPWPKERLLRSSQDCLGNLAFAVLECIRVLIELRLAHTELAAPCAPRCDGRLHPGKKPDRLCGMQLEIGSNRHQCLDRGLRARLLGYPGLQLAQPVRERIDVKNRRKPPLAPSHMQKSMIVQMVVHVGNQD